MNETNLYELWLKAKENIYYRGTYEEFKEKMADGENRAKLFNAISPLIDDIGSNVMEFDVYLGYRDEDDDSVHTSLAQGVLDIERPLQLEQSQLDAKKEDLKEFKKSNNEFNPYTSSWKESYNRGREYGEEKEILKDDIKSTKLTVQNLLTQKGELVKGSMEYWDNDVLRERYSDNTVNYNWAAHEPLRDLVESGDASPLQKKENRKYNKKQDEAEEEILEKGMAEFDEIAAPQVEQFNIYKRQLDEVETKLAYLEFSSKARDLTPEEKASAVELINLQNDLAEKANEIGSTLKEIDAERMLLYAQRMAMHDNIAELGYTGGVIIKSKFGNRMLSSAIRIGGWIQGLNANLAKKYSKVLGIDDEETNAALDAVVEEYGMLARSIDELIMSPTKYDTKFLDLSQINTPREYVKRFTSKASEISSTLVPLGLTSFFSGGAISPTWALGGAMYGSDVYFDLREHAPEMPDSERWNISFATGLIAGRIDASVNRVLTRPFVEAMALSNSKTLLKRNILKKGSLSIKDLFVPGSRGRIFTMANMGSNLTAGAGGNAAQEAVVNWGKLVAQERESDSGRKIYYTPSGEDMLSWENQLSNIQEGALMGAFGALLWSGASSTLSLVYKGKSGFTNYDLIQSLTSKPKLKKAFYEQLDAMVKEGMITQEQANETKKTIKLAEEVIQSFPADVVKANKLDNDTKAKIADLLYKRNKIQLENIDGKDPILAQKAQEAVNELNKQIQDIIDSFEVNVALGEYVYANENAEILEFMNSQEQDLVSSLNVKSEKEQTDKQKESEKKKWLKKNKYNVFDTKTGKLLGEDIKHGIPLRKDYNALIHTKKASQVQVVRFIKLLKTAFPGVEVVIDSKRWSQAAPKDKENSRGFVHSDGRIFINMDKATVDTPFHEFSHIWLAAIRYHNKPLYDRYVELIQGTKYQLRAMESTGERNSKGKLLNARVVNDEAIVEALGRKGQIVFNELEKQNDYYNLYEDLTDWLADVFGYSSGKNFKNATLNDLLTYASKDMVKGKKSKYAFGLEDAMKVEFDPTTENEGTVLHDRNRFDPNKAESTRKPRVKKGKSYVIKPKGLTYNHKDPATQFAMYTLKYDVIPESGGRDLLSPKIDYGLPTNDLRQAQKNLNQGKETKALTRALDELINMYRNGYVNIITGSGGKALHTIIPIDGWIASDPQLESALHEVIGENNKRMQPEVKAARFQLVGENSEIRGEVRQNLMIAKWAEQQKKTPLEIRRMTGWERGAEGKWRYEISDIEFKDIVTIINTRTILNNSIKTSLNEIIENSLNGQLEEFKLSDLVKDRELFEHYPKLKDLHVIINLKLKPNSELTFKSEKIGLYSPADNVIWVKPNRDLTLFKSVLVHELQHVIQHIEGFAKGANEVIAARYLLELQYEEAIPLFETVLDSRSSIVEREKAKDAIDELIDESQIYEDEVHATYLEFAGEVEARNVQNRLNLSDKERRNNLLSSTEDVAREEQIVIFEKSGDTKIPRFQPNDDISKSERPEMQPEQTFYSNTLDALSKTKMEKGKAEQWISKLIKDGIKGTSKEIYSTGINEALTTYQKDNKFKSLDKETVRGIIETLVTPLETVVLSKEKLETQVGHSKQVLDGGTNYREFLIKDSSRELKFNNTHYGVEFNNYTDGKNVIVTLRVDDRVDPNGEKIMFVQEIQSDWAQKGQREGFNKKENTSKIKELKADKQKVLNSSAPYRLLNEKTEGDLSLDVFNAVQQKATDAIDNQYSTKESRKESFLDDVERLISYWERYRSTPKMNKNEWSNFYDTYILELKDDSKKVSGYGRSYRLASLSTKIEDLDSQIFENSEKKTGTPSLPWNQTDLWVGLAIRKIINQASKEGYDQIAFVNGEQSDIVQGHIGENKGSTHYFYNTVVSKNINNELNRLVKGMKYEVKSVEFKKVTLKEFQASIRYESSTSGIDFFKYKTQQFKWYEPELTISSGLISTSFRRPNGGLVNGFYTRTDLGLDEYNATDRDIISAVSKVLYNNILQYVPIDQSKNAVINLTPELKAATIKEGIPRFQPNDDISKSERPEMQKLIDKRIKKGVTKNDFNKKELIAVHNIRPDELQHTIQELDGELPVPSLAIIKAEQGLSKFGDITLVAEKDMVDPELFGNRVFNTDAYSPRTPERKFVINENHLYNLSSIVKNALGEDLSSTYDSEIYSVSEEVLSGRNSIEQMAERLTLSDPVRIAYLRLNQEPLRLTTEDKVTRYVHKSPEVLDFIKSHQLKGRTQFEIHDMITSDKAMQAEILEIMRESLSNTRIWEKFKGSIINKDGEIYFNDITHISFALVDIANNVQIYDRNKITAQLNNKINTKKERAAFKEWVKEKLIPVYGEAYIQKGKKKLDYNIDNLVDMMVGEPRAKEQTLTYGVSNAKAATSKEFISLDDVLQGKDKLESKTVVSESLDALKERSADLHESLEFSTDNFWENNNNSRRAIATYVKGSKKGINAAIRALEKHGAINVTESQAADLILLANDLMSLPTEYFEAKPQRAVSLSEFSGAIIPRSTPKATVSKLKEFGLKVRYYDPKNESSRTEVLNSQFSNMRFQVEARPESNRPSVFQDLAQPEMDVTKQIEKSIIEPSVTTVRLSEALKSSNKEYRERALSNLGIAQENHSKGVDGVRNWLMTSWVKDLEGAWVYEPINTKGKFTTDVQANNIYNLYEIYNHPELFRVYPFLNELDVHVASKEAKDGDINVSLDKVSNLNEFIINEVQDAIQKAEGVTGKPKYKRAKVNYKDLAILEGTIQVDEKGNYRFQPEKKDGEDTKAEKLFKDLEFPRAFLPRILNDISYSDEVMQFLQEGDVKYLRLTNRVSMAEAKDIITVRGIEEASQLVTDGHPDLHPAIRVTLALELRSIFDDQARRSDKAEEIVDIGKKAANVFAPLVIDLTRAGQMIQAATMLNAMSEYSIVPTMERVLKRPLTNTESSDLKKLARDVDQAPVGSRKNKALHSLNLYKLQMKGMKKSDIAQSVWYANVLSGISTHARNVSANTWMFTFSQLEQMIINPKRWYHSLRGIPKGFRRGVDEFVNIMSTGESAVKTQSKFEVPGVLEVLAREKGGWKKIISNLKYVHRALAAADAFAYYGLNENRAYMLAYDAVKDLPGAKNIKKAMNEYLAVNNEKIKAFKEQAEKEGLTGRDLRRRVYDLMDESRGILPVKPGEKLTDKQKALREIDRENRNNMNLAEADRYAAEGTFNHEPMGLLGDFAKGFEKMARSSQSTMALKYIVPFTRIVTNVTNSYLSYTPIGLISAVRGREGLVSKKKLSHEQRVTILIRSALGMGMGWLAMGLSDPEDGVINITADGSANLEDNYELRKAGWRPYTITIGNKQFSYIDTPLFFVLAAVGSVRDHQRWGDKGEEAELKFMQKLELMSIGSAMSILDTSWLINIQDLLSTTTIDKSATLDDEVERFGRLFGRIGKSFFIPNALTQISRATQELSGAPMKKVDKFFFDAIIRDLPWLRNSLQDLHDSHGDDVIPEALHRWLPMQASTQHVDELTKEYTDMALFVGRPKRRSIIDKNYEQRDMTDQEYAEYYKLSAQKIKAIISKELPYIKSLPDEDRKSYFNYLKSTYRSEAYYELFTDY